MPRPALRELHRHIAIVIGIAVLTIPPCILLLYLLLSGKLA